MNKPIIKKNWLYRNWLWLLPITLIFTCLLLFFSLTGNAAFRYGSVYLDQTLVTNAFIKAKEHKTVTQKLGELSPVDFFQLLEGEVQYSNNNTSIEVTVGIKGTKGRGKMDIVAHKNNQQWEYDVINVRIKKPEKELIKILP
ncbi:hypothetical protein GCM10022393_28920 [Aquimarina addita]|uniref:Cytochrome oxidase complex assembly protein 1 n=1 Tax=Aquimarina addita TaxID=870485 RepID=A0ABP6UN34_9FLAO